MPVPAVSSLSDTSSLGLHDPERDHQLLMEDISENQVELEVLQNFARGTGRHRFNFVHQFQMEKDRLVSVDHIRRLVRARARVDHRLEVLHHAHHAHHHHHIHTALTSPPHRQMHSHVAASPGSTGAGTWTLPVGSSSTSNADWIARVQQEEERLRLFDQKIAAAVDDHHTIYNDDGIDFVDSEMQAWEKANERRRFASP